MRFLVFGLAVAAMAGELETARDKQDKATLTRLAQAAGSPYQKALAYSYLSEVSLELKEKKEARIAAQAGIQAAQAAVQAEPAKAEAHRLLGTLCGQVIPADPLAGMQHGKCAKQEIEKALQLDPKSALAWLSAGVGKFYLPPMFGGGLDLAMKDFQKAAALDPKLAEAWLWVGLAQRKGNKNAEARTSLQKAVGLAPQRIWIKQQLEKTPAS